MGHVHDLWPGQIGGHFWWTLVYMCHSSLFYYACSIQREVLYCTLLVLLHVIIITFLYNRTFTLCYLLLLERDYTQIDTDGVEKIVLYALVHYMCTCIQSTTVCRPISVPSRLRLLYRKTRKEASVHILLSTEFFRYHSYVIRSISQREKSISYPINIDNTDISWWGSRAYYIHEQCIQH